MNIKCMLGLHKWVDTKIPPKRKYDDKGNVIVQYVLKCERCNKGRIEEY